jgi:hypothetical protein
VCVVKLGLVTGFGFKDAMFGSDLHKMGIW